MAIPSRYVTALPPSHQPRAHHDVFEHLVEQVADVNVAVGKGRTVVKGKWLTAFAGRDHGVIQAHTVPPFHRRSFILREVGTHRERGCGEVEGLAPVGLGVFAHRQCRIWHDGQ